MAGLKEYFTGLLSVCVICTLCDMLSDFVSPGIARALGAVCSLALFFTVFSTLFNSCGKISEPHSLIPQDLEAIEDDYAESEALFIENTRTELEKNLSEAIYEKFGIKVHSISIEFSTDKKEDITEISVSSAEIVLPSGTDEILLSAADAFADSLFGIDVKTTINRSD